MKKLNAGDRCQVESQGEWLPATILTVYPGHSGALVLPDSWATPVWAKASQIRIPENRPNYAENQNVLVRNRAYGEWVDGTFVAWADVSHERAWVVTDELGTQRYHHTNIRPARIAPDPHDTAYQGEVGDHQPYKTATVEITPQVSGFLDKLRSPKKREFSPGGPIAQPTFTQRMAHVGITGKDERDAYLELILEFAKMGLTAEQVMPYVGVLGRIIVHGFTPDEADNNTTRALKTRYAPRPILYSTNRECQD